MFRFIYPLSHKPITSGIKSNARNDASETNLMACCMKPYNFKGAAMSLYCIKAHFGSIDNGTKFNVVAQQTSDYTCFSRPICQILALLCQYLAYGTRARV